MERLRRIARAAANDESAEKGQDKFLLTEDGYAVSDSDGGLGARLPERPRSRCMEMWWMLCSLMLAFYSLLLTIYVIKEPSDIACAKKLSMWSPLNEAIKYDDVVIENGFDHETNYRGTPTPELEEAWEGLWGVGVAPFPGDKLELVNKTAELPDGRRLMSSLDDENSYVSQFGVFHQLHCLNLLRQYTWRDWYPLHTDVVETPSSMLDTDAGARMHADHCIEALRISIMCQGDTTAFFTVVGPGAPADAEGDFSPQRRCRDFGRLREWALENQVEDPRPAHGA